ncbi:riboflavin synthase [Tepidimicrobium xylanilyticum]|uniref:Riboflavin synthase n=1 Tax=Tepidimicrobium xylanilyticum TaxID=1123352 RepID=A0A1H2TKN8_9FIRM|nr:riboflavin synthase [Tepidimicrobium xylanilyticum]GMG95917.1 riboflavin synthase subunit alpha [Tepidimicrobium xylanilyticum]SDW44523.1 riboflavin synthase alpha chain [Tepidimicrobium xylanilyticum]
MFTGLVEEVGKVLDIKKSNKIWTMTFECKKIVEDITIGDSIAINGVCLTVKEFDKNLFKVDVMAETIRKTNLGFIQSGDYVNFERALRVGDRLGGHVVTGHIDGTGVIEEIEEEGDSMWITISSSKDILKYIVHKGSIAIDGVSLTISFVDEEKFKVAIIPHTKVVTTLATKKINDLVNIECDLVGKYIERFLSYKKVQNESKIDINFLKNNGFIQG